MPRKSNMQQKGKKRPGRGWYFTSPLPISKFLWNFLKHIGGKWLFFLCYIILKSYSHFQQPSGGTVLEEPIVEILKESLTMASNFGYGYRNEKSFWLYKPRYLLNWNGIDCVYKVIGSKCIDMFTFLWLLTLSEHFCKKKSTYIDI